LENLTELLKGNLEGAVLEIIGHGETYGYEITHRLQDLGFTDIVDGTTYTILIRLEKQGLVDIEKRKSQQGPPRKFYQLNTAGESKRQDFWKKFDYINEKLNELRK